MSSAVTPQTGPGPHHRRWRRHLRLRGAALRPPLAALGIALLAGEADAKPPAGGVFCDKYKDAPECLGKQPSCTLCHVAPPQRNPFGAAIESKLAPGAPLVLDWRVRDEASQRPLTELRLALVNAPR